MEFVSAPLMYVACYITHGFVFSILFLVTSHSNLQLSVCDTCSCEWTTRHAPAN